MSIGRVRTEGTERGPWGGKAGAGFTLIEFLVVIAVIALLMAILVPALHRARGAGRRALCMAHLRQMQIAWQTYAENHDGFIVCGVPVFWQEHPEREGWLIDVSVDSGRPQSRAQAEAWMRTGALAPYVGNVKIYRCPSQYKQGPFHTTPEEPMYIQWLSAYGIVSPMNYWAASDRARWEADYIKYRGSSPIPMCITNLSHLNPPGPSGRMVFLDAGCPSLTMVDSAPDFPIMWDTMLTRKWWGAGPPIHHSKGTVTSFADGHVQYWKWKDPYTVTWSQAWLDWCDRGGTRPEEDPRFPADPDNQDYAEFYEAIWGKGP